MMWRIGSEVVLSKDHGIIIVLPRGTIDRNAIKGGGGSMLKSFQDIGKSHNILIHSPHTIVQLYSDDDCFNGWRFDSSQ